MRIKFDLKDADDARTIEALCAQMEGAVPRADGESDEDYAVRCIEKFADDVVAAHIIRPAEDLRAAKAQEAVIEVNARLERRAKKSG